MVSKKIFGAMALVLLSVLLTSFVSAVTNVDVEYVKLDGDELTLGSANPLELERDGTWDIKVKLDSAVDADDIFVDARIDGYEYNNKGTRIFDSDGPFDVTAGRDKFAKLNLAIPRDIKDGRYNLKISVRNSLETTVYNYELAVEKTGRNSLFIEDVVFSPEYGVKAGRALLATVRIENDGQKDEEGVKVRVSIPELEIAASDYIDEVERDDEVTSEELYLRIPTCAKSGNYVAEVEVTFDNGYETLRETKTVKVIEGDACTQDSEESTAKAEGKTTITVGPASQDVKAGQSGVIYPVVLTNSGSTTKTYTVGVEMGSWGEAQVNPSNLAVLESGESKAVYVYVSAKENAQVGEQLFALTVKSGNEVLKQVTLKANIVGSEESAEPNMSNIKRGLEIGLVVLVVLLVILGLIIGFNKLKGSEEDDEELGEGQTYY